MARKTTHEVLVHAITEDGIPALRLVKVTAQYHRIVDGALIFRNYRNNDYPEMVQTFAAGHWLEIR